MIANNALMINIMSDIKILQIKGAMRVTMRFI